MISNNEWVNTFNYLRSEMEYKVDSPCTKGCFIFIKAVSDLDSSLLLQDKLITYSIIVNKKDSVILSPVNQKIRGNFDTNKTQYTFRFNLFNIRKFQVVLSGSLVKYKFINIDASVPCCDTFDKIYYPEEGSTFIDSVIGDDETQKYNVTIDIVAISTQPDPYLSHYKITVIPFSYSNYPIYYVSDTLSIDCYTGKEHNGIYIIYERQQYENWADTVFLAFLKSELHESFTISIFYFPYYKYEHLPRVNREEAFFDKEEELWTTHKTEIVSYGMTKEDLIYTGILIKITLKNDSKMSFSVNQMGALFNYPIPNEKNVFYLKQQSISLLHLLPEGASSSFSKDYSFLFQIEKTMGYAYLVFNNTDYLLEGYTYFYINSEELKQEILITAPQYTYSIGFIHVEPLAALSDSINMFKEDKITYYEFPSEPFPLYFFMKLNKTMTSLVVTFKLRYENFEQYTIYPLNKLNIELSYIDENDFELYKKEKHSFNTSEQVQIEKTFVEIPTVSFRDLNVEHFIKYDYAFIKLSQKKNNGTIKH